MTKLLVNNETLMNQVKELKKLHKDDKEISFFINRLINGLEKDLEYNLFIDADIETINVLIQEDRKIEPYTDEEIRHYLNNPEGKLMPILCSYRTSKKLYLYSKSLVFPHTITKKNETILDILKAVIEFKDIDSKCDDSKEEGVQGFPVYVPESTRRILHQLLGKENPLYKLIQLFEDNSDN